MATKERPILFSCEMVRAILEGRKTQTRRVIKVHDAELYGYNKNQFVADGVWYPTTPSGKVGTVKEVKCPYGQPGDILWVRETWRTGSDADALPINQFSPSNQTIWFRADEPWNTDVKWRSSTHMPRWASRLSLRITNVRVERLQEISEDDAVSESIPRIQCSPDYPVGCIPWNGDNGWYFGVADSHPGGYIWSLDYKQAFSELWDSINGEKHPFQSNPWVWVIEFEVIQ